MNTQKGFMPLTLLAVIALGIIAGSVYIYTQHRKEVSAEPAVVVGEKVMEQPSVAKTTSKSTGVTACLPKGVGLTQVVSVDANGVKTTVDQTLKADGAQCSNGKLVDSKGKEIRFYNLTGCWGNPPQGYGDILAKQDAEIKSLKLKYTVIEMTCNPLGGVIY